jgi:hypothetical protein
MFGLRPPPRVGLSSVAPAARAARLSRYCLIPPLIPVHKIPHTSDDCLELVSHSASLSPILFHQSVTTRRKAIVGCCSSPCKHRLKINLSSCVLVGRTIPQGRRCLEDMTSSSDKMVLLMANGNVAASCLVQTSNRAIFKPHSGGSFPLGVVTSSCHLYRH